MGHKVHPLSFRLGYIKDWRSRWYANHKDFGIKLLEDHAVRKYIRKIFASANVSLVEIERAGDPGDGYKTPQTILCIPTEPCLMLVWFPKETGHPAEAPKPRPSCSNCVPKLPGVVYHAKI